MRTQHELQLVHAPHEVGEFPFAARLGARDVRSVSAILRTGVDEVVRSFSTPCWWMPDSWAKALRPTTALLYCTGYPVSRLTSRLVRASSSERMPQSMPP